MRSGTYAGSCSTAGREEVSAAQAPPQAQTRRLRGLAWRLLPAVVAFGAAAWWASGAGLMAAVSGCRPLPLLAGILLQVAAAAVLGLRWRAVLEGVGVWPIPTTRAAAVLSVRAQAASALAPGGLGADALRGYEAGFGKEMLGRLTKVAVIERVTGAWVLAAACVASVLPLVAQAWGGFAAAGAVAVVGAGLVFPRWVRLPGILIRLRPVMGWTVVNQLLALSGFAAGLFATGVHSSFADLAALASVAAFATMIPVSFNGYGVRELALAFLAPRLGLDSRVVVAASLVAATAMLGGLVVAGLAARAIRVEKGGGELG